MPWKSQFLYTSITPRRGQKIPNPERGAQAHPLGALWRTGRAATGCRSTGPTSVIRKATKLGFSECRESGVRRRTTGVTHALPPAIPVTITELYRSLRWGGDARRNSPLARCRTWTERRERKASPAQERSVSWRAAQWYGLQAGTVFWPQAWGKVTGRRRAPAKRGRRAKRICRSASESEGIAFPVPVLRLLMNGDG